MASGRFSLLLVAPLVLCAAALSAQTTNGTISGHVEDTQGLAIPGVTVSVASPSLQGTRTVTTSTSGDYVVSLLPPGMYSVSFELTDFQKQTRTVTVAPTQTVPLDVTLGPATLSEAVSVIGSAADVLTQTAQVATNYRQELVATLATNRDINAYLLMAPAVHPTGPSGNYSISGSMSYESLYMVNGVNVNENIRGQANTLYIEDAVEETTIATAGISAEYGRFGGGVVNVVTKSGGNIFRGSLRDTLFDDNWRALTPFPGDSKTVKVVPTYEYTLGGPIMHDRLWFFTAGRLQNQEQTRQTVITNIPYTFTDNSQRYEGKATYSANSSHRIEGNYVKVGRDQVNNTANTALSMELKVLNPRSLPQDLFSVNYNGIVSRQLTVEVRGSSRRFSFKGDGAPTTDLINGTQITDRQRNGAYYWSPTFCGVCDPEKRDNREFFIKGSYFASSGVLGSHDMTFGYDYFNDKRFSNNHQSGSDWVINGTTSIVRGTDIFPQFLGDGSTFINYRPILQSSKGTNFLTHAGFYNDHWRVNNHLVLNLGVRYDRNHGLDSAGQLVSKDSAVSPRLGAVWSPTGDGVWSVTGSFAKYVAGLANTSNVADAGSGAGRPALFQWVYRGPAINPDSNDPSPIAPDVALRQLFNWFNANGGQNMTLNSVTYPGVSTRILKSLASPNALEFAGGVSRQLGPSGALRLDGVYRDYRDFYANRTDTTTGKASSPAGQTFDLTVVENTNVVKRKYAGLSAQISFRVAATLDVGGNYTVSHAYGSIDGENVGSGPIASSVLRYPEYKDPKWNNTEGDLSVDQRHRARLWATYDVARLRGLSVGVLEDLGSGVPYNAVGSIDARPYVTNPGYLTPQGGSTVDYYFSTRDAFHTEGYSRTDLALDYKRALAGRHASEVFGQVQVVNLFNQFQLCGCGGSVFANGGNITQTNVDQSILTNSNAAARFQAFNPFTAAPVQGTNWDYGPNFGKALNRFAYTSPRTVRLSFGVRF
jgi:outer membrane receptor for ferrienterochelin and colicin